MMTKAHGLPSETKVDLRHRLQRALRPAAGLLLVGMAACLLLGSLRNDLLYPSEPVFDISSRVLLWIIGGLAGVLGVVCLFARSEFLAASTVAWFTFTLLLYRVALSVMGAPDAQAYLAMTAADYGVSPRVFEMLLAAVVVIAGVWSWGRMFGCFADNLDNPAEPSSEKKQLTAARLGLWMAAAAICAPAAAQPSGEEGPAGFEATGCLTYTTYDPLGSPTGKKVLLFRLECRHGLWRIRTEPAIRMQNGIAFHDSSRLPPTSLILITGFEGAEKTGSPLEAARTRAYSEKGDDLNFQNVPITIPPEIARLASRPPRPQTSQTVRGPALTGRTSTNPAPILAEAAVFESLYPPADASYVALLRFAFMPPERSTNNMLPQIWDDGHPRSVRFRVAHWERFDAPPGLISRASFFRPPDVVGRKNIRQDANLAYASLEAAYEVQSTTNLNGLVLPVSFSLTRYSFPKTPSDPSHIVTTDSVVVFEARTTHPAEPLSVGVPVRTVVNDFRAGDAKKPGTPLVYVIEPGQIPGTAEVKQSKLYQRAQRPSPHSTAASPHIRLGVIIAAAVISLLPLLLLKSRIGQRRNKK